MASEDLNDAKEWLEYAKADLGVADHLFKTYSLSRWLLSAIIASKQQKKL